MLGRRFVVNRPLSNPSESQNLRLMGMTVGMTNIARWTLANESPCPQLHLALHPRIGMVYVGDGDLFAGVNIPIGENWLTA